MSQFVFKLPDLGEGTVEAEIVEWHVKPGDEVAEEDVIVDVMTDKATVELPAPVSGRVVSTTGGAGDMVAVGSPLIVFETDARAPAAANDNSVADQTGKPASGPPAAAADPDKRSPETAPAAAAPGRAENDTTPVAAGAKVITSPAIRRRAREAGIDLSVVPGSGPRGRIVRADFDSFLKHREAPGSARPSGRAPATGTVEIKVIGLRRVIAERLSAAKRTIPHFAYVEETDVTQLESLRRHLNDRRPAGENNLTYLPFIALAMIRALRDFPQCNAHYDDQRNVIVRHNAVHLGIATQTPQGLKVPVVRHAEACSLEQLAASIRRVTQAARDNTATKNELTGSTITLTSLGKLGGIVSTPVINAPEVAIVGVNKAVERPMIVDGQIAVRRMMNLSSSFDHRFVDGHDAAAMIQAVKDLIEQPATIFMED